MFFVGFKKTSATSLKNYMLAVANREIKLDQALTKATKGKKRDTSKFLKTVKGFQRHIENPISMEMMSGLDRHAAKHGLTAEQKHNLLTTPGTARVAKMKGSFDPELKLGRHSGALGAWGEKAEHLQKTTRNPLESIRGEARKLGRRDRHYAGKWNDFSKELTGKIKSLKNKKKK